MIAFRPFCFTVALALLPALAGAVDLTLPTGARPVAAIDSALDSYDLPVGPYIDGKVAVREVEGRVVRRTWRIEGSSLTTLQIFDPLRQQLAERGFQTVFGCVDSVCGGFDFRFGIEVIPAPDMYVDIRNFRFLAAARDDGSVASLLVSGSRSAAYVQMIEVTPLVQARPRRDAGGAVSNWAGDPTDLVTRLQRDGHVILNDLIFGSGAGDLGPGPYESLTSLADFLKGNPDYKVMLVGHTDSVGSLKDNIALSKRRAGAVRERLIDALGAPPARVLAEGNGFLSPIASNLTPEGRRANRRVEAILLPR
jgi:OmpA-OmpF porin, OOP family